MDYSGHFLQYLNGGEPVFAAPPFAGREGARLRSLFAFVTGGPAPKARAEAAAAYRGPRAGEDGHRAETVRVPLLLRKDLDVALARQQTPMTAIVARYFAAHVQISVASQSREFGIGSEAVAGGLSKEEARERAVLRRYLPRSLRGGRRGGRRDAEEPDPERAFGALFRGAEAETPLEGRGGRRLAEAFRFATKARWTDGRSRLEMKQTGVRLPGLLAEAMRATERRQTPTLTELVTRYLTLHDYLSRPEARSPEGAFA